MRRVRDRCSGLILINPELWREKEGDIEYLAAICVGHTFWYYPTLTEINDDDWGDGDVCFVEGCNNFASYSYEFIGDDLEKLENNKVKETPLKRLPLLIGSLEYDSSIDILEKRLRDQSGG